MLYIPLLELILCLSFLRESHCQIRLVQAEKMIPPPPWLRNRIMARKGRDLTFLVEKTIGDGDRFSLSLPSKQLMAEFLTDLENSVLKQGEMDVVLVEPSLETCRLTMKRWEVNKAGNTSSQGAVYVLGSNDGAWNKVSSRNEIRKGSTVGVWSFRAGVVEAELCFAISRLDETEKARDKWEADKGAEKGRDLLDISPGYFSGPDWIDSYYDD